MHKKAEHFIFIVYIMTSWMVSQH